MVSYIIVIFLSKSNNNDPHTPRLVKTFINCNDFSARSAQDVFLGQFIVSTDIAEHIFDFSVLNCVS